MKSFFNLYNIKDIYFDKKKGIKRLFQTRFDKPFIDKIQQKLIYLSLNNLTKTLITKLISFIFYSLSFIIVLDWFID